MKKRVRIKSPGVFGIWKYFVQTSYFGIWWSDIHSTDSWFKAKEKADQYVNAKIIYPPFPEEV